MTNYNPFAPVASLRKMEEEAEDNVAYLKVKERSK